MIFLSEIIQLLYSTQIEHVIDLHSNKNLR